MASFDLTIEDIRVLQHAEEHCDRGAIARILGIGAWSKLASWSTTRPARGRNGSE